jgi:NHL repeat
MDLQSLNQPLSLAVDEDGMILVADYSNHRIQLLTPRLQLVRHLLTSENNIQYPRNVCFDFRRHLLFVGLDSGEIKVFPAHFDDDDDDKNE